MQKALVASVITIALLVGMIVGYVLHPVPVSASQSKFIGFSCAGVFDEINCYALKPDGTRITSKWVRSELLD